MGILDKTTSYIKEKAREYIQENVEDIVFIKDKENILNIKIKFRTKEARDKIGEALKELFERLLNP